MPSRRLLLMNTRKRIAMIAHDNRKHDLLDWARCNRGVLLHHDLFATGTTGSIIPVACNRATADFLVSSPLMKEEYRRLTMGVEDQLVRWVQPVPVERPQSESISTELPTQLLMQEPRAVS